MIPHSNYIKKNVIYDVEIFFRVNYTAYESLRMGCIQLHFVAIMQKGRKKIMQNDEKISMTFKVASFRKIPILFLTEDYKDDTSNMYIAICDVMDVPADIPMKTNPREQKLTTNVAKKIKESLKRLGKGRETNGNTK